MIQAVSIAMGLVILVLFSEAIYISMQRPSRYQIYLLIMVVSTVVMLTGYLCEIRANDLEASLLGCGVAYMGKPFALLASLLFTAEFCNIRIPKGVKIGLACLGALFPLLVLTNSYHHLFYYTVEFSRSRPFSPLILTHGPLYYLNMLNIGINALLSVYMIVRTFVRARTKAERRQLAYLMALFFFTVAGYLLYLTGITFGYDTTMLGAVAGAFSLFMLFTRYRMFDALTLAKDQALDMLSNGVLVLNSHLTDVYSNRIMSDLLQSDFTLPELQNLADGSCRFRRNSRLYDVHKRDVWSGGRSYGKVLELSDVTAESNYADRLEQEVAARTRELKSVQRTVIASFAGIVEARDSSTGRHINQMTHYVSLISDELLREGLFPGELTPDYITCLVDVAPLHDIGKLTIPDAILKKPGKLTDEEFRIMQQHSASGARIIAQCLEGVETQDYVQMAETVALYHHEKWNGTGYPQHLAGANIPLAARIIAIADVYDAVRSERVYKPPMTREQAIAVLRDGSGTHFDPVIVDAFLKVLPEADE